ncbi:oligopeptide ABC transporter substrate-binding protein OppA [Mycoplasma putrefaciens]|uniref:oligopeptide ABC transporter substrate-binding protein OppA n=1 Tax=Mycoplasma putrefaciens TaxID=2123 RepID=UPI003DA48883
MKKILGLTTSTLLIASSSMTAVSCSLGVNPYKLLSRRISDTTVYKDLITQPIVTWNSAINNSSSDGKVISKLQDTLITVDKHDNFEGALALKWKSSEDAKSWEFKLRKNIKWTAIENGKAVDKGAITAKDFFNTFRYVFNKNNRALTLDIWGSALANANKLIDFLNKLSNPTYNKDTKKPDDLYDPRFDRENAGEPKSNLLKKEMISSYYLDRAIMAFNIETNEQKAKEMALNTTMSTKNIEDKSFKEGKIISKGDSDYDIKYHLEKPTSYFETIISYLSFAPMPSISVQYIGDRHQKGSKFAGTLYAKPSEKQSGYETMWYSGPYIVDEYVSGRNLNLKRNEHYFNKQNVHINKMLFTYTNKGDPASSRYYFETGDISSFKVVPNDITGWSKYVGNKIDNPSFMGTNVVRTKPTTSWAFAFNYQSSGTSIYRNVRLDNQGNLIDGARTTRNKNEDAELNKTIALNSFRVMFRYLLDRSIFAKFHSSAIDGNKRLSSSLRNTYTSPFIATVESNASETTTSSSLSSGKNTDYLDFMAQNYYDIDKEVKEQDEKSIVGWLIKILEKKNLLEKTDIEKWNNKFGKVNNANGKKKSSLSPGNDTFFENDLLALLAFLEEDSTEDIKSTEKIYKEPDKVKFKNQDLAMQFINLIGKYDEIDESRPYPEQDQKLKFLNQKVKLIKQQVKEDMKKIGVNKQDPLTIPFLLNPGNSSTGGSSGYINYLIQAFKTFNFLVRKKGAEDTDSPFVIDPYTPGTAKEYGELAREGKSAIMEIGWSPDYADPTNYLYTVLYGGAFDYIMNMDKVFNKDTSGDFTIAESIKTEENHYKQLKKITEFLSKEVESVDKKESDKTKRFTSLAKLENYLNLSSALIIPTYVRESEFLPTVSFVDQLTISRFPIGSQPDRMVGVKLQNHIMQRDEFEQKLKTFNDEKQKGYQSLYPNEDGQYINNFKGKWNDEVDSKRT